MGQAFFITVFVAIGMVVLAYRYWTRATGHMLLATVCFWLITFGLVWLNETVPLEDELLRDTGEWFAAAPGMIALFLTVGTAIVFLVGLFEKSMKFFERKEG